MQVRREGIAFARKAGTALFAAVTLCITFFLFGPGVIYLTNTHEYSIPFQTFVPGLLHMLAPLAVGLSLILMVMPKKYGLFQRGIAVVVLLAFLGYVYCTIIVWQYGVLDNREINWSAHKIRFVVDVVVAGLFLWLLWKYWRVISHKAIKLCLILLALQGVSLFITGSEQGGERTNQKKYVDSTYRFDFSNKENVIFIVVDTLPERMLVEAFQDQEYREYFNSFTRFNDCAAGYVTTIASVGLMLTGKYYDNSQTFDDYYQQTLSSPTSLTGYCKEKDYVIDIYSGMTNTHSAAFSQVASNTTKNASVTLKEVSTLAGAALFRCAPHSLKFLFSSVEWHTDLITDDIIGIWDFGFLKDMQEAYFTRDISQPYFAFYHFNGFHLPQIVDENFNINKKGVTEIANAKACLKLVHLFLEKLKKNNLFDKSTIIITADHTDYIAKKANMPINGNVPLLVKPKGAANRPLRSVSTPVSLADIPSIAIHSIENPDSPPESALLQEKRYFHDYDWGDTWTAKFLPMMTKYEIVGSSSLADSYQEIGTLPPGVKPLALNQSVRVDFINNHSDFTGNIAGSFNHDKNVGLIPTTYRSDLFFRFSDISTSHIKVSTEGTFDKGDIPPISIYGITTAGKSFGQANNDVSFIMKTPVEMWMRFNNIRNISAITFEPIERDSKVVMNQQYNFSEQKSYELFIGEQSGFSIRESWGVWSQANTAQLSIPWKTIPSTPVIAFFGCSALTNTVCPEQRVTVYANGKQIAFRKFDDNNKPARWAIELNPEWFAGASTWTLDFLFPDAIIPKEHGLSADRRKLAFSLQTVQFATTEQENDKQ